MIRRIGKRGKEWLRTRKRWIKENPPNHQGYWVCGICYRWVHESEMQLDHIQPRGSNPGLVHSFSNLRPVHPVCNSAKGSSKH